MTPPRPVTVHLVRHGEVFNPDRVLYGRLPGFALSERGQAMAARIAQVLSAVAEGPARVGVIVSSPLQRAQQTAAPTAAALGLSVGSDDRLIEAANLLQGRRVSAAVLLNREFRRSLRHPLLPGWGEPYEQVAARMWAAIGAAVAQADAAGSAALLVSHQLPIWTARRWGQRRRLWHDPRARQCALASLTSLTFDLAELGPAGSGPPDPRRLREALVGVDYSEPARDLVAGSDDVMAAPPTVAPPTVAPAAVAGQRS